MLIIQAFIESPEFLLFFFFSKIVLKLFEIFLNTKQSYVLDPPLLVWTCLFHLAVCRMLIDNRNACHSGF